MCDWLTACLAGNRKSLPPVNDMQGMAFVATVLDHAELHMRSIAAHAAAARVSILRGMIDAVFQARRRTWVLASSRSEEHTSELKQLMRISYAHFCLTKKTNK